MAHWRITATRPILGVVFLEVSGLRIHVEQAGDGPSLLLLHGWGASAQSFAAIVPALAQRFRVSAMDLPGFGLSAMPAGVWGVDDFADSVVGLLRRLEIPRTHVLGHSHGGRAGIAVAQRFPELVNRLVLVDSAGIRPPRNLRTRLRGLTARTGRKVLGHPLAGAAGRRALQQFYRSLGMNDYASAGPLRSTFVRIVNEDLSERFPCIKAPTLVVWGARDTETPLWMGERMAEAIPAARLEVLPSAGHFPFLDDPRSFERLVDSFLTDEQP